MNPEGEDLVQEQDPQEVDLEELIQQHTGQVIEGEEALVEDEQATLKLLERLNCFGGIENKRKGNNRPNPPSCRA